jgi:ABC-type transporter MlaC component
MNVRWLLSAIILLTIPQIMLAKIKGPDTFMSESTESILAQLEAFSENNESSLLEEKAQEDKNRSLLDSEQIRQELILLIESTIVPHVDIEFMAKWVAGRSVWVEADEQQKKDFVLGFKQLLIDSYANTLMILSDKNFYFKLIKTTPGKETKAQVLCVVEQESGGNFHVIFQMKSDESSWKIFDVVIEGISLLKALKSQFEDDFRTQGIDGVTSMMREGLYKV